MGVCSGRLKRGGGSLVRAQLEKGGLRCESNSKKGGLRCGSGQKGGGGVFTAAHTYTEHICEYPPKIKVT